MAVLSVVVEPGRLKLEPQAPPVRVAVAVGGDAARAKRVRLWASAGTLGQPRQTGPGRIEATWRAPPSGPPQWVVVAAWDDATGDVSHAVVELAGRVEIPVDTEPGTEVAAVAGSRRASARSDAQGHARVILWVPPGVASAKVTARDAAGNTTTEDVPLAVPQPARVWMAQGDERRVYAFAATGAQPELRADGGLEGIQRRQGVATARASGAGEATVRAQVPGGEASLTVRGGASASGAAVDLAAGGSPFVQPRDEIGLTAGARFSGALAGVAFTFQWRRQLARSRVHMGFDVSGVYARDDTGRIRHETGGVIARAVFDVHLPVAERLAFYLGAGLGAMIASDHRLNTANMRAESSVEGGPSLGAHAGMLVRAGPGFVDLEVGYYWTPLVGQNLLVLDGGMFSIGYRYGIF
jgi:hypothetical protein